MVILDGYASVKVWGQLPGREHSAVYQDGGSSETTGPSAQPDHWQHNEGHQSSCHHSTSRCGHTRQSSLKTRVVNIAALDKKIKEMFNKALPTHSVKVF